MRVLAKVLTCAVSLAMVLALTPGGLYAGPQAPPPATPPPPQQAAPPPGQPAPEQPQGALLTPEQLQELVAPIALYPDALVAQILAASAYPTQIVEAERFLQANPNLTGTALGNAVNGQDWDPSVKALTQFPSVLADMDKNLSWTSTLGDANLNQQADVMSAIQFLRQKAQAAGNLKSTQQQTVTDQNSTVVIQPANPQVVYVPDYNPEFVYGYPIGLWPGFYPWWGGIYGPYLSFGVGFGIGPFFGFGWGWPAWGFDWYHHGLLYGGGLYAFHSHAFYDRNAYFRGNYRGSAPYGRGDRSLRGFAPAGRAASPAARPGSASRPNAFGGITRGGDARTFSSRGRSSFGGGVRGGGGGFHGGGGGSHGGGGRR